MTAPTPGKILVVDDDRLVLATLAHGLSQAGYDVLDADNGDDAILLARAERPDLALLDIRMQGLSGFDVAAYLREYCRIPFMFLSAFSDAETQAQVKALGAVACLTKPLDIQQILPVVAGVFESLLAAPPAGNATRADTRAETEAEAPPVALAPEVLMAVGVLMHGHSLTRQTAFDRLHRMAASERLTLEAQATRLLEAVERLAGPAAG